MCYRRVIFASSGTSDLPARNEKHKKVQFQSNRTKNQSSKFPPNFITMKIYSSRQRVNFPLPTFPSKLMILIYLHLLQIEGILTETSVRSCTLPNFIACIIKYCQVSITFPPKCWKKNSETRKNVEKVEKLKHFFTTKEVIRWDIKNVY